MPEENIIDEPIGKIFGKLGISGLAAALVTIIFGVVILLKVVDLELIVGLYLIIVGVIQLVGNIPAITAKK